MKWLMVVLISFAPGVAFSAEICENYAKYFSIRDYKKNLGSVQGSDGMQYESELISVTTFPDGDEYLYEVSISEKNEDGEYWTVNYEVLLEHDPSTQKCSLLKLKSEHQD